MVKTLKDLFLALLNATLVLVLLCLFFGWKLASTVDDVAGKVTDAVQSLAPIRDQAQSLRGELTALRSDLSTLSLEGQEIDPETAQRVRQTLGRLNGIEEQLRLVQTRISEMAESPDALIDRAIQTGADTVAQRVMLIKGCVPET